MRKNKRGQALVEFIIILPVFLLMVLGMIDIGKILFERNSLENKVEDAVTLYKEEKTFDEILSFLKENDEKIQLEIANENNEYVSIQIQKDLEVITPGLNLIFKNPYQVKASRVIYYETE